MVFRFRLSTLLLLTTGVAVGLILWLRYIRPNVGGVSLQSGSVVLHMTDEFAQRQFARDPTLKSLYPAPQDGFVFYHDSYISLPLFGLFTGFAVVAALAVVAYYLFRVCCRYISSRFGSARTENEAPT